MDLRSEQLKDTYGNLVTTGTTAGSPTSGGLQNGQGTLLTSVGIGTNSPSRTLSVYSTSSIPCQIESSGADARISILTSSGSGGQGFVQASSGSLLLGSSNTERMRIKSTGDISFRDGSANEAFYWDASTARLGIGNQAPTVALDVTGDIALSNDLYVSNGNFIKLQRNSGGLYLDVLGTPSGTDDVRLLTSGAFDIVNGSLTSLLKIDTSGRVGIGVTPSAKLHVNDTTYPTLRLSTATSYSNIYHDGTTGSIAYSADDGGAIASSSHQFYIDGAPAMKLDGTGLGIGTTSPDSILEIAGTTPTLTIDDTRAGSWVSGDKLGTVSFRTSDGSGAGAREIGFIHIENEQAGTNTTMSGAMVFGSSAYNASATERMRITSGGDVEITGGYTSATAFQTTGALRVVSNSTTNTGDVGAEFLNDATGTRFLCSFANNNGVVGSISTLGTATSFNTSSDYRLKENVVEMTGALDRVDQLNPSRFNFIADADRTVDGFLAHEVADVVPEAISGEKDATEEYEVTPAVLDDEGNVIQEAVMGTRPVYQGIDQSKLVPLLVGAIQELRAEIEQLKNQ